MFDEARLRAVLPVAGLGAPLHLLPTVGSTNDYAADLARRGAAHGTLVVADAQTSGRGRRGREWWTPAGSALALSLVLRPGKTGVAPAAWNTLGALAVAEALEDLGGTTAVKWPNDVLLDGRKVCGVLAEAAWQGDAMEHLIIGIGVNVRRDSVPAELAVEFPATCLEDVLGHAVDREDLLTRIVRRLAAWIPRLGSDGWREAVEGRLAYRGRRVRASEAGAEIQGRIVGLDAGGRLLLDRGGAQPVAISSDGATIRLVDGERG